MWIFLSVACSLPAQGLEALSLDLPAAQHAVAVPRERFAFPLDPGCSGPVQHTHLEVGLDRVWFRSNELGLPIADGLIAAGAKQDRVVGDLHSALAETAQFIETSGCKASSKLELLISADQRVPWTTLEEVIYTAEKANYTHLFFEVVDSEPPAVGAWSSGPIAPVEVTLTPSGASLKKRGTVEKLALTELPGALAGSAAALVVPSDGMSVHDVVAGFDTLAGAQLRHGVFVGLGEASLPANVPVHSPTTTKQLASKQSMAVLPVRITKMRPREEVEENGKVLDILAGEPSESPEEEVTFAPLQPADAGVSEVVRRFKNQLKYCYQRELNKDATLAGEVTIEFIVSADGTVKSASPESSSESLERAVSCIEGRFLRMKFPERGAPQTFRAPMSLQPAK